MEDTKKKCVCCSALKEKDAFTKNKAKKDGLSAYCRLCNSVKAKERGLRAVDRIREYNKRYYAELSPEKRERLKEQKKKYKEENKERLVAYSKAYYAENRDKFTQGARDYYLKHKEEAAEANRNWLKNNKERRSEVQKIWYNNNPAKASEARFRRRTRLRKNGIYYISEKEITKLLSSNCYICQANPSEHLDHIVPISKGGTHSIGNLLGACQRCNLEKGSKTLYEYKRQRAIREVLRPL